MTGPLVVITAASSGVGLALARAFAKEGIKTNIHQGGISFEEYCQLLGNPDFLSAGELAEVALYCWKLPPTICIRDIVVAPTRSGF